MVMRFACSLWLGNEFQEVINRPLSSNCFCGTNTQNSILMTTKVINNNDKHHPRTSS